MIRLLIDYVGLLNCMFRRRFLLASGGVVGGINIAGAVQAREASNNWRMFQDDTSEGFATNQGQGGDGPPADSPPEIRWRFNTDGPLHMGPAIVDDIAYFGSEDGHVYAVEDGAERWRYQATAPVTSRLRSWAIACTSAAMMGWFARLTSPRARSVGANAFLQMSHRLSSPETPSI